MVANMEEPNKIPNWMKHDCLLMLYEQAKSAQSDLEPDMDFLSDPHLGRYPEYLLKSLELPENIWNFLNHVGLPDRFAAWRSPEEEQEDKNKECCFGVVFSLRCLRIQTIQKRKYLIIGEDWSLDRFSSVCDGFWSWWKTESSTYIIADQKSGTVWKWIHDLDEDFLLYINSSLEQYLLSMAYWQAFYPVFAQKVRQFTDQNPQKTELDYIFKHRKTLYAPFWNRLKALDPEAAKKRQGYWKFMCDLSLY